MNFIKRNANVIILFLAELAAGILLLIEPVGFTSGIIIAAGIIFLATGIICVVRYFRTEAREAARNQLLAKGLASLLMGWFCTFRSEWFVVTFPILTVLYGIFVLLAGLWKIQLTADLVRMKTGKWPPAAISAAISLVCAVVILNNPFAATEVLWMFTGITLIIEAVFDLITLVISSKTIKNAQSES